MGKLLFGAAAVIVGGSFLFAWALCRAAAIGDAQSANAHSWRQLDLELDAATADVR